MKVVALISGGKDSCYVMLKCQSYGHEIVALAHITPPSCCPEPDSMMYQSVGTDAVPAIADALGLPLYTRRTSASTRITSLAYAHSVVDVKQSQDEVEDLLDLLKDVKQGHPEIEAVCAGALWSDYQRLRVESVASRLGLLTLAYLWRREQSELLDEMISSGVHAVIVKVAGIGLEEKHLGKSLAEMRPHLKRLEAEYGSHICGEGGEYETLVLSLPSFKHDLEYFNDDFEVVHQSETPYNVVAYLNIRKVHTKLRSSNNAKYPVQDWRPSVPPLPDSLSRIDNDIYVQPSALQKSSQSSNFAMASNGTSTSYGSSRRIGDYMYIIAQSNKPGAEGVLAATNYLRYSLRDCCSIASDSNRDPLEHVLYVVLRLSSLEGDDYAFVNKAYKAEFGIADCNPPPSRACIAMEGTGYAVTLEALARIERRSDPATVTVHVQSLSEWAPPCIGPYAQTVFDAGVLHVCGVLPLHAPTAAIPEGLGARAQTRACLYNMSRTLEATPGKMDDLGLILAYVLDRRMSNVVEEEAKCFLGSSFRGIFVIIPVHALPKSALVEIRAVGCIGGPTVCETNLRREIQVSRLTYVVDEFTTTDSASVVQQVKARFKTKSLLSLHLLCVEDMLECDGPMVHESKREEIQQSLRKSDLNCALLVIGVDWLAHGASALVIALLVPE